MFDSGITVSELIGNIRAEADISYPVPDESFVLWLNSLEQLIYREIIKEQGQCMVSDIAMGYIDLSALNIPTNEREVRFEDIHAIYADCTQLIKSSLASGVIFEDTYYKIGDGIGLKLKKQPDNLKIIYFVRPALKDVQKMGSEHVMIPIEFLDLAKAKLRGEAYKMANEDNLAAKWLNDYNISLETFKAWIEEKRSKFGI